jgi:uncharacterized membrane protein YeiH
MFQFLDIIGMAFAMSGALTAMNKKWILLGVYHRVTAVGGVRAAEKT